MLGRFRQEGRLASAITHPRCVFVLAADEEEGRPFIIMELMPGSNLQDLVREKGPLPAAEAVPKILDAIEGLREAHRLGVIHRDVKPSNCFLEADGRVKIGDFGLSKSLVSDANLTRTGSFLGTPLYASPEQIKGDAVDPRTDVYSVSATLYYLLTGRAPFQGSDAAATLARIVSDPPPPPRSIRPDIPPDLERVVLKGLERSRDRRYRDLDGLAAALSPFAPGRTTMASLWLRSAAYFIDVFLSKYPVLIVVGGVRVVTSRELVLSHLVQDMYLNAVMDPLVILVAYFLVESLTGASPAKWLLGLRVRGDGSSGTTLGRMWLRATIFYALTALPWEAVTIAGHHLGFLRGREWLMPWLAPWGWRCSARR